MKFRFLLWMIAVLLRRAVRREPEAARHVAGRRVTFQIRSLDGIGRHYRIDGGKITSAPGIAPASDFALTFSDAAAGFRILSAKDSKGAFLQGLHDHELVVSGDFTKVMWFQRLTDFLQPDK